MIDISETLTTMFKPMPHVLCVQGMIRRMMMDPVAAWVVDHATGMDRQGNELAPLCYKDFTPECLDPGGALHQPKYERFP